MMDAIKSLWRDEEGATLVEYGLMIALIAVVCILVIGALGGKVWTAFDVTQSEIGTPEPTPPTP